MPLTFPRLAALPAAALLALLPAGAPAQMMMNTLDLGIQQIQQSSGLSVSIGQSMMNSDLPWRSGTDSRGYDRRDDGPDRRGDAPRRGPAPAPRAVTATTFTPVGPPLVPREVASVWPAERRAEAEGVYTRWLDEYRALARGKRLVPNDVARAASYLVANIAAIELGRDLTARQLEPMRRQMHDFFARSPAFARMSNRERQQLFEIYVIMGTILDDRYRAARSRNDTQDLRRLHAINDRWTRDLLHAPVEQIRFTDAGIVIR